jgi:hypothetical protein
VDDHFRVTVGIEAVTAFFKISAQFGEVVDLAVENDPNCFVFVEHRLVSAGQIDNAETAHAQSHAAFY